MGRVGSRPGAGGRVAAGAAALAARLRPGTRGLAEEGPRRVAREGRRGLSRRCEVAAPCAQPKRTAHHVAWQMKYRNIWYNIKNCGITISYYWFVVLHGDFIALQLYNNIINI